MRKTPSMTYKAGWLGLAFLMMTASSLALPNSAPAQAVASAPKPDQGAAADPLFTQPYIDKDEWRGTTVRYRYVHGGFKGTDTRFSFYFPEKAAYGGRFFQYITPTPDSETLSQGQTGEEDRIGFALSSGGYFIETNGGGASQNGMIGAHVDPTVAAYRANAASARYSRVVAMEMYGPKRPYGYAFGGSGGAYRTIGGAENTTGVWDGVVPYVIATPMAIPSVFSVRMHAMRVLDGKFPQIIDAVEPGGGDMYAGLNDEQRDALREATRMGFPPKSWFGYKTMGVHAFTVLYPGVAMADPSYFTDFWTKPGYLGFDPPASLKAARLQFKTTIGAPITASLAVKEGLKIGREANMGRGTADTAWKAMLAQGDAAPAIGFRLAQTPPPVEFLGGDLLILSGAGAGKSVPLRSLDGAIAELGFADQATVALIKPGDEVQVDNSNFLAAQTYHRHQVPGPEYKVWDQFRGADGKPIYPQRPMLLGPIFTQNAAGTVATGKFGGKMIVVESLWDREAFPWQADWYRARVTEHLGAKTNDNFRLWYVDHSLHSDSTKQEDPTHTVSYLGVLWQALRDLSAWVEKDTPPPATTAYRIEDGQVIVPPDAVARLGVQPVVTAKANGGVRAEVKVGQPVTLTGVITAPPGAGGVVAAEWDFDGAGKFPEHSPVKVGTRTATVSITHSFDKPGVYFVTLRGGSQRQGDPTTPFARLQNLDRVRVVVK